MEPDGAVYTNVHRALLQSFLARGTLTLKAARPVVASILTVHEGREVLANDISESDFSSLVSVINSAVSKYDLEIRSSLTQLGQHADHGQGAPPSGGSRSYGDRVYALVNTTSDAVAQLATSRTPEELAYLARMLDDMFDKYNHESGKEIMAISHNQAVRLHKASPQQRSRASLGEFNGTAESPPQVATPGLTMKQAEATLRSIVDEGWLERVGTSHDAYYILTPRALLELKSWLIETYNEPGDPHAPAEDDEADGGPGRRGVEKIKLCAACNDVVISGQRCDDKRCRARLHDGCTGAMWRSQRGESRCPQCGRPWAGTDFVGVRAAGVSLSR